MLKILALDLEKDDKDPILIELYNNLAHINDLEQAANSAKAERDVNVLKIALLEEQLKAASTELAKQRGLLSSRGLIGKNID